MRLSLWCGLRTARAFRDVKNAKPDYTPIPGLVQRVLERTMILLVAALAGLRCSSGCPFAAAVGGTQRLAPQDRAGGLEAPALHLLCEMLGRERAVGAPDHADDDRS